MDSSIPELTEQIDHRGRTGAFLGGLVQRAGRPAVDHCVCGETTRGVEEGGEVAGGDVERGNADNEADRGNCHRYRDVETTLFVAVAGESHEE